MLTARVRNQGDIERPRGARAFSLVELLVVIAIITLLISILLPALGSARRAARLVRCEANMRQMGTGYYSYASDARGWLAAFSWQPGKAYSQWTELNNANSPTDAHCNQATDIVRRVTGRMQPKFDGRMVSRNYTHMILIDGGYFGSDKLPELGVVCSEDSAAQLWAKTPPEQIESLVAQQLAPADGTAQYRQILPYWSSYQLVPAVWATDTGAAAITQVTTDYRLYAFSPTSTRFLNRRMDDFAFPSQKVVFFDLFDRHHFRRPLFHAYPNASQPLIFADGSVQVRFTRDSNKGWHPNSPTNLNTVTSYRYKPIDFGDPPALSGAAAGDLVTGYYRWARWGVRGVDFGAKEPTKRP